MVRDYEKPADRLRLLAQLGAATLVKLGEPASDDLTRFFDQAERIRPEMVAALRAAGENDDFVREQLHFLHTATLWAQSGFNVFSLTHGLAAGLLLTEPPEYVDGEEFRIPFPVTAVLIPPGIVPVFAHGEQTWAELIWCYRFRSPRKASQKIEDFIRISAQHGWLNVFRDRSPFHMVIPQDEAIYNQPDDPPVQDEDLLTHDAVFRLLRNLLAWLESTGGLAQRKPEGRPPQRGRKTAPQSWPTTWVLGREVKLARELRQMAEEISLGRSRHERGGWRLRMRHVVRGHWKNQAHGEGRTLRRRIWVEPYWRGPEGAAAWSHLYTAEGA